MKKNNRFIRFLSMVLSVLMIAGCLSGTALAALSYSSYSSVPIDSYQSFRNAVMGKAYNIDGDHGAQCWDGACILWKRLGMNLQTGDHTARGCWKLKKTANAGTKFELITNIKDVKRGDVIVFSAGNNGHIGFADENYKNNGNINVLGQNQGTNKRTKVGKGDSCGRCYESAFNITTWSTSTFLGAFRYKVWNPSRNTTHTFSYDLNGGTGTFATVSVKYGTNITLPTAKPERAGYTFVGWNAHRTTDNTWYVGSTGWLTESEITAKGYEKRLYTTGTYLINDSWTKGLSDNTAYTFVAVWEKNAAPLLTVQSSTDMSGDPLGKFDVYINGKAVKTGVSQFTGTYSVDTAYEIKNVKGTGCYVLSSGAPALSGKLTEDTRLMLGFTEKHSYVKNTVKPTCIEDGYIEYTCSECGDSYAVTAADDWSLTKPDAPDADIETKTVYRYSTDKKTSDAASLNGYVKAGTEWQKTGEGTIDYAESFPAGFNKSSSLYTQYNVKPKTASETSAEKTTVTTTTAGYIYWHWCRNYTAGPINRSIKSNKADDFTTFHAFFSTKDVALTTSANARQIDNASVCKDTYWWLNERVTIKRCAYTQYKKVNVFVKWSDWQDAKPTASGALTETSTMYRLRVSESLQSTGHTWDAGKVTKAATASAEGVKTFTCTVCGETKTETIPKTNNAFKRGDVDNDGKVSSSDARLALRGAVGFTGDKDVKNAVINFADKTSRAFLAANVDGDGKISASDARLILRASVGLEKF